MKEGRYEECLNDDDVRQCRNIAAAVYCRADSHLQVVYTLFTLIIFASFCYTLRSSSSKLRSNETISHSQLEHYIDKLKSKVTFIFCFLRNDNNDDYEEWERTQEKKKRMEDIKFLKIQELYLLCIFYKFSVLWAVLCRTDWTTFAISLK